MFSTTKDVWFIATNAQQARLMHCYLAPLGARHVCMVDEVVFDVVEHEHGRPSPLGAKSGHSYAAAHHDEEENQRRVARQVIDWVKAARQKHHFGPAVIFAPPRMLGRLRELIDKRDRLVLVGADLVNTDIRTLHTHPAVVGFLDECLPPAPVRSA